MIKFPSVPPMSLDREIAALEYQRNINLNEIQRLNNEIRDKFRNLNWPNETLNKYVETNKPIQNLIKKNGELAQNITLLTLLKKKSQPNRYEELLNEKEKIDKEEEEDLMKEFAK